MKVEYKFKSRKFGETKRLIAEMAEAKKKGERVLYLGKCGLDGKKLKVEK